MLSKAILENKIVFFNPFMQVNVTPIILGVIITCLLSAVISLDRSNDVTSNIMLRHKIVVECENPYKDRGEAGTRTRHFIQCPKGWGEVG